MAAEAPDDGGANAAQVAYWNSPASAGWLSEQERLDAVFAPLTDALLAFAAPAPGERAVDVGCGAGATVLALARAVGPAGGVLGLDVSERLVARARERVAEAGLRHARVELADAASHAFGPEADLVFSRFGVMFFDDPVAAFGNLRRALRPGGGGRLAFAAWRPLAENPWFRLPVEAARPHLSPATEPPPEPGAPGPFAFDDPARVRGILEGAGWRAVGIEAHDTALRLAPPGGAEDAARGSAGVGPLARALAGADDGTRRRAVAAAAEALRAHDGPGGVALPGAVWLVSARA